MNEENKEIVETEECREIASQKKLNKILLLAFIGMTLIAAGLIIALAAANKEKSKTTGTTPTVTETAANATETPALTQTASRSEANIPRLSSSSLMKGAVIAA